VTYDPSFDNWIAAMQFWSYSSPGGDGGGGGQSPEPERAPDEAPCDKANETTLNPPDNAKYYVPEKVTSDYLNKVAQHVIDFSKTRSYADTVLEIEAMYTDMSHPFFIDFKDYGTSRGPWESESAGNIGYYSDAAGGYVTANAFEPFGNFFYGFIMTLAGFTPEGTSFYAALMSETGFGDDPQDKPHVQYGIAMAQQYLAKGQAEHAFGIKQQSCSG